MSSSIEIDIGSMCIAVPELTGESVNPACRRTLIYSSARGRPKNGAIAVSKWIWMPSSHSCGRLALRARFTSRWFLSARLDGCACRTPFQLAGFPNDDSKNDEQYASRDGSRRRAEIVGADTSDHRSDHEGAHHSTEADDVPSRYQVPVRDPL